jgi:hypothetical protein
MQETESGETTLELFPISNKKETITRNVCTSNQYLVWLFGSVSSDSEENRNLFLHQAYPKTATCLRVVFPPYVSFLALQHKACPLVY